MSKNGAREKKYSYYSRVGKHLPTNTPVACVRGERERMKTANRSHRSSDVCSYGGGKVPCIRFIERVRVTYTTAIDVNGYIKRIKTVNFIDIVVRCCFLRPTATCIRPSNGGFFFLIVVSCYRRVK